MPKIERNTHEIEIGKEEDIEIKGQRFRLYVQNRYTLISLAVDLLTGIFYIFGSLATLTKIPDRYGTYCYLAGAVFLTLRPILRIVRNIFIYDDKKAKDKERRSKQ
ncbi:MULTISPECIES: YrhK family protein [unclassified Enterococcus]|uniref:YrhK family protein n=1 Tax=unclassified Enterococcus TaxID=2608891 RepID=UPI0013EB59CC|nr:MULTISPECIES: YrhK family protein [unclassified Enterococcus]